MGSPPHVRGKEVDTIAETAVTGITPACAGKRVVIRLVFAAMWDHPRMCGEKACRARCAESCTGSPPHVRGKAFGTTTEKTWPWITPACAGKSLVQLQPGQPAAGSPPHVRGKDHSRCHIQGDDGITPACAGKRSSIFSLLRGSGDHPRMCGEKRNRKA